MNAEYEWLRLIVFSADAVHGWDKGIPQKSAVSGRMYDGFQRGTRGDSGWFRANQIISSPKEVVRRLSSSSSPEIQPAAHFSRRMEF